MYNRQPLSEAKEHTHLIIAAITADKKTQCRLMGLGLGIGKEIELLRNRHGDVVLKNGNSRISLGQGVARQVLTHVSPRDGQ